MLRCRIRFYRSKPRTSLEAYFDIKFHLSKLGTCLEAHIAFRFHLSDLVPGTFDIPLYTYVGAEFASNLRTQFMSEPFLQERIL